MKHLIKQTLFVQVMTMMLLITTPQFMMEVQAQGFLKKLKNKAKKKLGKKKTRNTNRYGNVSAEDQAYNKYIYDNYELLKALEHNISPAPGTAKTKAQKLDYPNVYKKLTTQKKAQGKDRYYDYLLEFKEKRWDGFKKHYIQLMNEYYDEAYKKNKSYGIEMALETMQGGKDYGEVLLAFGDEVKQDASFKAAQDLVAKGLNDLQGKKNKNLKNVATSDFHLKNMGKILFSKRPIVIGKEDPAQFTTSFNANDKIYAVAYFDKALKEMGYSNSTHVKKARYNLRFNGKQEFHNNISFTFERELVDQSYFLLEIIPDPNLAIHKTSAMDWYRKLAELSPRKHTLEVWFWSSGGANKQRAASDKITLDWTGADITKLKTNAELAVKRSENNFARLRTLPPIFTYPAKRFKDARLSSANIRRMLMAKIRNCAQVLKIHPVAFGAADWKIEKNDVGIPKYKQSNGRIAITFRGKDGWCYFVHYARLVQDYQGGGRYGKLVLYNDKPKKIACSRLK
ncbi:hypothetical protein BKI52_42965 [marine bacterium AO1-C]|nr:hypothetical protein BKI52_42965 [marine bacterium AO1-C]